MWRCLPALLTVAVVCLLPAWASEPGEPLDCSDWVFLEPGLSCTPWVSFPCEEDENPFCGNTKREKRRWKPATG